MGDRVLCIEAGYENATDTGTELLIKQNAEGIVRAVGCPPPREAAADSRIALVRFYGFARDARMPRSRLKRFSESKPGGPE